MTEGARARPRRVRVAPLRVEYETSPLPISAWLLIAGLSLLLLGAFQFVPDRVSITSLKHPVPIRRQEGNSILRQDDRAFIINRVIRGEALDADYLVMGSSAAREATYDSDGLQGAVEAECGARPAFVELTTPGAGPLEALFLISRNGLKAHQTVLLVISPGNLHVTASTGADNAMFDGDYVEDGAKFAREFQQALPFLQLKLDPAVSLQRKFELSRRLFHRHTHVALNNWAMQQVFGFEWPPYRKIKFANASPTTRQRMDRGRKKALGLVQNLLETDASAYERNMEVLRILAEYAEERGARMVLIESPIVMDEHEASFGGAIWQRYSEDIAAIVASTPVDYIDFNDRAGLAVSDFADTRHVIESGRRKWSAALAQSVCALELQ